MYEVVPDKTARAGTIEKLATNNLWPRESVVAIRAHTVRSYIQDVMTKVKSTWVHNKKYPCQLELR